MQFMLRDDLYFCKNADAVILLDTRIGRYSALPGVFVGAFSRYIDGCQLSSDDLQILGQLAQQGILVGAADQPQRLNSKFEPLPSPEVEIGYADRLPSFSLAVSAITSRLIWTWRVRHQSFSSLIDRIKKVRSRPSRGTGKRSTRDLGRLANAFRFADLLLGSHDCCLPRSLALVATARKYGLNPVLVIGIQVAPFAAHCWVQDGNVVANESPDRAQMFTPILVA
ncbi:lasso peptide biosynthesis B2 protein [Sphingobium sp. BHU LFT2]|uniref:lasso peptide biosynthesis B2 protein n=1 Tax=Sphingobium sp. BHU LFT2 TaxID=2807634 RepID=UPI001BEA2EE5|nr:lasso peptide biosynthesis B2 protein [Sphingobium sp. BHU LFT2]MBT2246732.1 lasso peptide biosynthesis B2 protein [Sphingobium sp. BHU LFT2]